jgi:hypothetical protein
MMMMMKNKIKTKGGNKHQREIADKVIRWCCDYFDLNEVDWVYVKLRPYEDCWGCCEEGLQKHSYNITIVHNQSLRSFVATIVHEMIHVKQWEIGRWIDDGEEEAELRQYNIADKIWKGSVI